MRPQSIAVVLALLLPSTLMANPAEQRFQLTQGKPAAIGGGITVTLDSGMYAHLSGSRNSSLIQLTVTRGKETQKVGLDRLEPGPPKYVKVMGVEIAVDYVDPYHQPTTAAIFVRSP